jgi:hypothetical protein
MGLFVESSPRNSIVFMVCQFFLDQWQQFSFITWLLLEPLTTTINHKIGADTTTLAYFMKIAYFRRRIAT